MQLLVYVHAAFAFTTRSAEPIAGFSNCPGCSEEAALLELRRKSTRHSTSLGLRSHDIGASPPNAAETKKAVVFIAYYETESSESNLKFFIDYSLRAGAVGVEYDIVVAESSQKSRRLYAHYKDKLSEQFRWLHFENEGMDFCLWKKAMQTVQSSSYKFFAFMNGSVRGPFVNCEKSKTWLQEFTSRLGPSKASDSHPVRLVGTTINCKSLDTTFEVHVQSMFLVTDGTGFEQMKAMWSCLDNKRAVITKHEVGTSKAFRERGWNLAVLEEYWRGWNFLDEKKTRERCYRAWGDPYYPGKEPFESGFRDVPPREVIMFKANRNVSRTEMERLTVESNKCNRDEKTHLTN